jgi:hypothetical protein
LPTTAIRLTARPAPPSRSRFAPNTLQYLLRIPVSGLDISQTGETHNMDLAVGICEYGSSKQKFRFYSNDLPKTVSDQLFRTFQTEGIPYYVALSPLPDARRMRVVLLDESTGLSGAVDIPILPSDIAKAAETPTPLLAFPPPPRPASVPFLEIPDKGPILPQPKAMGSLSFRTPSGVLGSLDWNGDALLFRGDGTIDQAAAAFFDYALGDKFHCHSGSLVSGDPAGGAAALRFAFHNHSGRVAIADLKGEKPDYLGDLPVDPGAQPFFDQVWRLSHCQ